MVEILPMLAKDIELVWELGIATPEFDTGDQSPRFYSQEALGRMVESDDCVCLVAKNKDDEVVGFILTSILTAPRDAIIHTIRVADDFQKQGVGAMLFDQTLTLLEQRPDDCNHYQLETQLRNWGVHSFLTKQGVTGGTPMLRFDGMLPRK